MSDVYEEILSSSNIQTILEHYGLNISKNKCLCPFHNDTNPSMSIHTGKGIAHCFSCGAGGNAVSFIQKYESEINNNPISFRDAMQKAIDIQGLNITIPSSNYTPLTEEQKLFQRQTGILRDVLNLNERNLKLNNSESKKAFDYLKNRHISLKTINSFHMGYAPNNKTYITETLSKKYETKDLVDLGISKIDEQGNILDVFNERITIPIFDENGNPVGFGARTINNAIKPKYLNTKANKLFNKSNLLFNFHQAKSYARNDEIIIVEGYMDVISAKEMKMDNVVGTMGTALTKEHINMLKKLKCDIVLCLDNDEPGKDAMARIIPELQKVKLKVDVIDISKLGNYKDFGDLQIAGMSREKIYQAKISAFTFLMQQNYIKNNELTVENIHNTYNKMWKDGLIKDTKDILNFKEYVMKNTNFKDDEIENIINPKKVDKPKENVIDRYKDVLFYSYIKELIKNYAIKHQDTILLKYVELDKLQSNSLMDSLNNPEFLKDGELTINIGGYIRDFLFKSEDYIKFKNNKVFILDNLLNNVKTFDNQGKEVDLKLTMEQKEMVIKQYNGSFDISIREYIENNPDEFEEIFIATNSEQFKKLFPKTYEENMRDSAINNFKNNGVMEAIKYAAAFSNDIKDKLDRKYVNNDKFKTLLVFNNNKNILGLTVDNIKKESTEKEIEQTKEKSVEKEEIKEKAKNPMSVFINLSGKERESYRGIYLPIDEENQVFIPKELYKKDNKKLEILNSESNHARMSEYKIDNKEQKMKFFSKLSLEQFYHKYLNLYEIQMEKEVMA